MVFSIWHSQWEETMKRIGMFLAVAVLVGTAWIPAANAAPKFFKVKVDSVGMATPTLLLMRLSDVKGTFKNKRFKSTRLIRKEILATALTAFALDSPVRVLTDVNAGPVPEILRLFITK